MKKEEKATVVLEKSKGTDESTAQLTVACGLWPATTARATHNKTARDALHCYRETQLQDGCVGQKA